MYRYTVLYLQYNRLSHSEIFGLMLVCSYPKLIAAYHVLLRLLVPRHPPYALIRFKYCIKIIGLATNFISFLPYYLPRTALLLHRQKLLSQYVKELKINDSMA